ncbi:MAG: hypothetical protein KDJ47_16735 [Hyphomicrobiaceae bacterium]|nr:hypothetical protein [Hyphomicrobiaceae bacterium]
MIDKLKGEPEPVRIDANEDWFKVSARHTNGKVHRAYASREGHIYSLSCSCPGSRNGSARKKCYLIANGWAAANCGN